MPLLSVIMPTFNGQRYLRPALESVAAEGTSDLELIAVDDGSTDDTVEILQSFAGKLPLRIEVRPHTGSWVRGTNIGLQLSSGDYVSFLHQDDFWLPGRMTILRHLAATYPDAEVLLHPSIFVDRANRRCGTWRCPFGSREVCLDWPDVLRHLVVQNFVSIPAPAVRRSAALSAMPLDEQLWFTADWKFWLSIGGSWAYSPDAHTAFRIHGASQTARSSHDSAAFREQLTAASAAFLGAVPESIQRAALLNIELNVFLAARFHAEPTEPARLWRSALSAGPAGICRAIHSSRLWERTLSRIRAGLKP